MLIIIAVVIGLPLVVLVTEIQIARSGVDIEAPDVASLHLEVPPPNIEPVGPTIRILWMGDSTAAAVGASSVEGAVSTQVVRRLVDLPNPFDVQVIAESGARIKEVVDSQMQRVRSLHPDVVVISVGANDTIHLTRTKNFRDSYAKLIDALKRNAVPPSHVVLVGVPDMGAPRRLLPPLRGIVGRRARRLDREVKKLGASVGAHYVDLFHATSKPFRAHPSKYFARDKYHPNDAGYALWADAIAPAVDAAIGP